MEYRAARCKYVAEVYLSILNARPDIASEENEFQNNIMSDPHLQGDGLIHSWREKFHKCILQNGHWWSLLGLWSIFMVISIF